MQTSCVGPWRWLSPPTPLFCVGDTNMLVSEYVFRPTQNIKFAFPPTQNPNASQWNIGCVGSLALGPCVGHVHFIFFVLISFALSTRRKRSFQWNMGYRVSAPNAWFLTFVIIVRLGDSTQTSSNNQPRRINKSLTHL